MTGFEMFLLGSVALMYAAIFVFGIVCLVRRDDIKAIKNMDNDIPKDVESNNQNNRNIRDRDNNRNFYNSRINDLLDSSMGNIHRQESSGRNIQTTQCYENGEITNLCTIIALKSIGREMKTMLSNIEKDAIDKAVDNTITVEKLKAFIDNIELEDIDIDE